MAVGGNWLALLQSRPVLRRIWFGALLSSLGDTLTWMALIWYVTEHTKDGSTVGILVLCTALPAALTGAPIGQLLDRYQPRTIMVVDNILRAVLIAVIPLLDHAGQLSFPLLCGVAALMGALAPATQVGTRLVVPQLVDETERADTNALLGLCEQAATVAGPAIAGILIASWGTTNALWVDSVSFIVMAWALLAVPPLPRQPQATQEKAPLPWKDLAQPTIAAITALSFLFFFSYGPTEVAIPLFVRHTLHTDARGLGALEMAVGVGALIVSLATGWLAQKQRIGAILATIMVLWGVCELGIAQSRTLLSACLAFFLGGIVWGPYLALKTTLMQRQIPTERLGAVMGLQSALLTPSAPLGTALGGVLLRFWPPVALLALAGGACLIGGLLAFLVPAIRRPRSTPQ